LRKKLFFSCCCFEEKWETNANRLSRKISFPEKIYIIYFSKINQMVESLTVFKLNSKSIRKHKANGPKVPHFQNANNKFHHVIKM
jgi:hypothetical protein